MVLSLEKVFYREMKDVRLIPKFTRAGGANSNLYFFAIPAHAPSNNISQKYTNSELHSKTIDLIVSLAELGWPPPLELNIDEMDQIKVEFIEKDSPAQNLEYTRYIEKMLLNFFDHERLNHMKKSWQTKAWFKDRYPLLDSAVQGHCLELFSLTVPVLLAQSEGLLVDGFRHMGYMGEIQQKMYFKKLLKTDKSKEYEESLNKYIADSLLMQSIHGQGEKTKLSKHAIAHGEDVEYGTAANSLRMILLVDFIQRAFRNIVEDKKKMYHKPGCLALIKSKEDLHHCRNKKKLIAKGYQACTMCHNNDQ